MFDVEQLTKKNKEFISIATKVLISAGASDDTVKDILKSAFPDILDNQKKGIPARQFLGAPSQWAMHCLQAPDGTETDDKAGHTNPWLMWGDAGLLMTGFLSLMLAGMTLIGQPNRYGILSILIMGFGIGGGIVMMSRYTLKQQAKTGGRPKIMQSLILIALITLSWSIILLLVLLIPKTYNPSLNPLNSAILGVGALGIRYGYKKLFHTQNPLQVQPPR